MTIASRYWTYAELLDKVEKDGDLEGEILCSRARCSATPMRQ